MNVTIVIPTFHRADLLAECEQALAAHTEPHQLVVVDNGFVGSPMIRPGQRTWVTEGRNLGFAAGCNRGAREEPDADVYVFLNDDCVPQPAWLAPLIRALDDGAQIAGPHLVYPDGRTQHAGVTVDMEAGTLVARNRTTPHPSGPIDAVTGACLAVQGRWFRLHGGFDEGYWNGYEDVDLCLQAEQVRFVAESLLIHHESQSGPERWTRVRENVDRLNKKWGGDRWPTTSRTPAS